MPRQRTVLTDEQFFASLNDRDDLTAVIHGHAELVRLLDDGIARLLADHGMTERAGATARRHGEGRRVDPLRSARH